MTVNGKFPLIFKKRTVRIAPCYAIFHPNQRKGSNELSRMHQHFDAKVGADSGLGATLKFDCGADGVVVIDGKSTPNTVDNNNRETECTVAITLENLTALLSGELEPVTGFMTGRFTVSGDMSVAMRLNRVV